MFGLIVYGSACANVGAASRGAPSMDAVLPNPHGQSGIHRNRPSKLWALFDEWLREIGAQPFAPGALKGEYASAEAATHAERKRVARAQPLL